MELRVLSVINQNCLTTTACEAVTASHYQAAVSIVPTVCVRLVEYISPKSLSMKDLCTILKCTPTLTPDPTSQISKTFNRLGLPWV